MLMLVLGLTSTPAADARPGRTAGPVAASSTYALTTVQFENRLVSRTNTRRANIGCPLLRVNTSLIKSSRGHSARMASTGEFSHQLPGEAYFSTRITRAGYTGWNLLAENIAYGYPSPQMIFSMWMHSTPHRENIENCRLRDIGVGVSYAGGNAWITMDLGHRR